MSNLGSTFKEQTDRFICKSDKLHPISGCQDRQRLGALVDSEIGRLLGWDEKDKLNGG